ncbi:MAG: primosomal protein N', partial [Alphaproteobacteria bacterium]|nr:primosomal protein N' [Alphaproteobacteria bacterium]
DGVPGSGKTEVYFQAIAAALESGHQALVLLPEIALGAQWLARFHARFGVEPAVWHSDIGHADRRATWRAVADGEAKVVVGARSALFLPFRDLGIIIVDEEHDGSYKQEDGVIYNARDMAVVRARLGKIPAVLVSATPSLETVANIEAGRYAVRHLPDRHGGAMMPDVSIIDMRAEKLPAGRWISNPLAQALAATLAAGEQAMLFLNRRGYAPLTLCRGCGHRFRCPNCSAWLVEHRSGQTARLRCHHCGFGAPLPGACPACQAEGKFAACGPGIERLAEEAHGIFPAARIAVAASDTLAGPEAAAELVRRIERDEIDLLIGTQIVAKGYHFPMLTLVGVVDADLGLAGGDLRAAERTYQLLYQVAGRAGRGERPGRVLLQTFMPSHPVMGALAAGDRGRFLLAESDARREAAMPPFGRLVALIVSGEREPDVEKAARALAAAQPADVGLRILGPAPAPLAFLRGRHRRRFLLKAARETQIQEIVRAWLQRADIPRSVRVQADVDPYGFL